MRTASLAKHFLVGICALNAASLDAKADCNFRDFVIQDVTAIQRSGETELAFVLTTNRDEFDRVKKNGSTSGGYGLIWGGANYDEARDKALRIAQATKFDYKNSYALNYFSQALSPSVAKAYGDCLEKDKEKPGLTLWLADRKGDNFYFKAFWVGADTRLAAAKWDADPVVDGGRVISKPDAWLKSKTETVVVKRNGNADFFIELKVGGQVTSETIVKDPPAVIWSEKPVTSDTLIKTASHGPNPGCSAGEVTDCIYPLHSGGSFLPKSASMTERSSSDPARYKETFDPDMPGKICVKMSQNTGDCRINQSAQGRLTAIERFPQAATEH